MPATQAAEPELSIVVLSWNVRDLLASCLGSLQAAAGGWWPRSEVLVVDNASTDGSAEMVRRDFPGVRVCALPRNLGFSAGNNAGIRASRGRLVFPLNPDTVAHPGSIEALCDYMDASPNVGIAGPRLLNPDGTLQPSRRRFPNLLTALIESTPLQQALPDAEVLRRFYMLDRPDDETQDVGWLSGAALMCRRETLDQAGLFDPGYFMFSEEVDLCKRVSDAGWRVVYVPRAEVTHFGGASTVQDVSSRHISFNASKVRYFRKQYGSVASELLRVYLLGTYAAQLASEAAKLALRHKPHLRRERIRMYAEVLRSGLREPRRNLSRKHNDVLLVTGEYPPARGGVGDYTCRLNLALAREGVSTRVLTRRVGDAALPEKQDAPKKVGGGLPPLLHPRITVPGVVEALKGTRSRVVHVQYQTGAYEMRPTVNLLPMLLRIVWRGKSVVTFHDLRVPYLFPKAGPAREWANRLLALGADAVVATTQEDAEQLRSWGVRRVETIPIGPNILNKPPEDYDRRAHRARIGVGPESVLVAYFGFLNSSKGLDDLLRAVAKLRASGGDYRLLMVGGGLGSSDPTNRTTAATLSALARELGVSDALIWTGYLGPRDVSAALLSADMAALPYSDGASFRRGSLLAVLEHGLPVVTTTAPARKNGSGPGLVDGENALLVPPGSVGALAEAIEKVASDQELRARLAHGAASLARGFSWEEIAARHKALYATLKEC